MLNDKTSHIEAEITKENKPKVIFLLRLWKYVFSSATVISSVYLGLYILLSLLRPLLAFIWGKYIDLAASYLPGGEVLPMILLVASYYVINFLAGLISRYVVPREDIERLDLVQANRFQEQVDTKLYKKLASINPEYWEVPKINDTVDRVLGFTSDRWGGMNAGVMRQSYLVIAKLVSVISIAASLYVFNPWLCFIVLVAPLPSLYTLLINQKLQFRFVKDNSKLLRKAQYFQNMMLKDGAKEVKTMGLFDFFYGKWKEVMDEYTVKEKKLYQTRTLLNILNDLVTSTANIAANIFAVVLLGLGRITIGALGAVMSLISTLLADTKELLTGVATFLTKKNEAALFYDMMDLKSQDGEHNNTEFTEITATNLRYRYPLTEKYVLDGLHVQIKKGEKVAFVGENGAGKTTFVKLITAMAAPSEGDLLINGVPVERVNSESRYRQISSVSQNPARYITFTVAENVCLGDTLTERDESEVDQALEFSGLGKDGKDELLGKEIGGTDLSGGQWQKLAIARACYRNRDFIILDEPTSNLDPLAETDVFKKFMEMAKGRTVIFVTHRISVAALAQRIMVFADGKIIEDGTHEQLMAYGGHYAKLYREQAKWYNR